MKEDLDKIKKFLTLIKKLVEDEQRGNKVHISEYAYPEHVQKMISDMELVIKHSK